MKEKQVDWVIAWWTVLRDRMNLKGKTALITGGLGIVGRICCEMVRELGGTDVVADTAADHATDVANRFMVESMSERTGKLDILINCAIGNQKPVNDPLKGWEQDLSIGLSGTAYCCRYFGEHMHKNGGGVILNIGSDLSHIAPNHELYPNGYYKPASYSAVKHGVIGLTRYFAVMWPNVRCNCLCPGGIYVGQRVPENPMRRLMYEEELKGPIALLITEAGSYMNGAVINVDGGRTII